MLTRWIGNPLVRLSFDQQRYEADFRFSLVRLRENAENVAFYGGEARELDSFQTRFARIIGNWWGIIRRRKKLTWLTTGYAQLAIVFPFIVAAPRYFNKVIQLGGLMQIASAFGQVQDSLSFIVSSYTEIAAVSGGGAAAFRVSRADGRDRGRAAARRSRSRSSAAAQGVEVDALDLDLPDGRAAAPGSGADGEPGRGAAGHRPVRRRQEHAAARDRRVVAVWPRPYPGRRRPQPVPAAAALSAARHARRRARLSARRRRAAA